MTRSASNCPSPRCATRLRALTADPLAGPRPAGRDRRPLRRLHRGIERDEEYVDETAELYDPAAEAAGSVEDEAEEDELVLDAPVLATKPARAVVMPVAPVAVAPVVLPPVAEIRAAPVRAPRARAAAGSKAKAAFTLRLNAERHLKLRLACAVTGRSAQQLVTEALDQLLGSMPELDSMADRAPAKRARS